MSGNYFHNSLFQQNPFLKTIFQGNCSTKPPFRGLTVQIRIFSKKALFQWDCISARTLFIGIVSQEPYLGMDHVFIGIVSARTFFKGIVSARTFFKGIVSARTFFKGTLFRGIVPQNPPVSWKLFQSIYLTCQNPGTIFLNIIEKLFPRAAFCSLNIHSKTRLSFQDTIIIPSNCLQGLFFLPFNYIKTAITHLTVPRGSVRSFHHFIPSLPHSAFVYIPTIQKLSPFQQTVFQQSIFQQPAIHQNQRSIK